MRNTSIEWCDDTVSPIMGCLGCEILETCYAHLDTNRRAAGGHMGYPRDFLIPTGFPGRVQKHAGLKDLAGTERGSKPWLRGLPRLVFIGDMGDTLSSSVPIEFVVREVIEPVRSPPGLRHQWLLLTKQPHRLKELEDAAGGFPTNLWIGTSITGRSSLKRATALMNAGSDRTIRFLSVEPQLEDLGEVPLEGVSWVIQGGESGAKARPFHLEWVQRLLEQCRGAGVPFFLKQLGSKPHRDGGRIRLEFSKGNEMDEWPQELRVREMPI